MKNVLITGASSGIGLETANVLSEFCNVFLCGRRKLDKKNYFSCDMSNTAEIPVLVEKANEYFGANVDILINCAGQYLYKPLEKMTLDEIDYFLNLNFKSAYILSSLLIPDMKKNKWGRIINIGSISGVVGEANATLYSASKSALSGFTKSLALEVAQYNITINQINPGWVETPLAQNALDENERNEVLDVIPQKRFITPIEVANLCKYLISEDARGLTGQNISLCAGLSCGC